MDPVFTTYCEYLSISIYICIPIYIYAYYIMGVYIYNTHIHYPATHTYTCVYRYIYIYTCMGCGWRSSAGSSSGPNCLPRFKLPKSWRRLNPQNNARVLRMLHWYTISRWYIEIDKIGRYKIDTRNKSFWKTTRTSAFTRKVVKQLFASHWFDGLPNRCRTILVSLQFWTAGVQKKPWKTSRIDQIPSSQGFSTHRHCGLCKDLKQSGPATGVLAPFRFIGAVETTK